LFVEFQKPFSGGGKWVLTDIADHNQLSSPARLAAKRRMIQSSCSQGKVDDIMRKLEQQRQESQIRAEQLWGLAEEMERKAEDSYKTACEFHSSAQGVRKKICQLKRSLEEAALDLRQRQALQSSEQATSMSDQKMSE